MSFDWKYQHPFLTNNIGISLSFAQLLLSKNCNVVIADTALRPGATKLVESYSGEKSGPRAVFVKTDVTDWAQLTNMFDVADAEFGGADIVSVKVSQSPNSALTLLARCVQELVYLSKHCFAGSVPRPTLTLRQTTLVQLLASSWLGDIERPTPRHQWNWSLRNFGH